ncbi:MAG: ABC transporter permease [Candidatus Krumholzibacteriota bacterium]|nr:ABC transporter permease [Candidatus Krumholzibacteriota bacterium]
MSNLKAFYRRFYGNRIAFAALIVLALIITAGLLSDVIAPAGTARIDLDNSLQPPSLEHPMGTDSFGRDLFSRVTRGSRVSLGVGLAARTISLFIGLVMGVIAGIYGGRIDSVIMRFADITFAFPTLLLLVAIMAVVAPGISTLITVLGIVGWAAIARLVRAQVMTVREREYVQAAESSGAGNLSLVIRHILPQCLSPVIVVYTMGLGMTIMAESSLSFLGLGVQPPSPSWGRMISDGIIFMRSAWWLTIFPGIILSLTICSLNLVGDGLRDAFDPKYIYSKGKE